MKIQITWFLLDEGRTHQILTYSYSEVLSINLSITKYCIHIHKLCVIADELLGNALRLLDLTLYNIKSRKAVFGFVEISTHSH